MESMRKIIGLKQKESVPWTDFAEQFFEKRISQLQLSFKLRLPVSMYCNTPKTNHVMVAG